MPTLYEERRDKVKELKASGALYCPWCLSTNVYVDRKGFGFGKAIIGGVLAGPIGLGAGLFGRKKVQAQCLSCHHKFNP